MKINKIIVFVCIGMINFNCTTVKSNPVIDFGVDNETNMPLDTTPIKWVDAEAQWDAYTLNMTAAWRNTSDIIDGWDFSHPSFVTANPNAQINTGSLSKFADIKEATGVTLTKFVRAYWNDLEPAEGEYDFSSLKEDVESAVAEGFSGVAIRLYATVYRAYGDDVETYYAAPKWLKTKYPDMYIVASDGNSADQGYNVDSYAIWDSRFHTHYLKFIKKLGESGILQMDGVAGCYVCAISESQGEEFYLSYKTVEAAKNDGGLSEELMTTILKERFDAWADAAGKDCCNKLIWVGSGEQGFLGDTDYNVTDYAVNKKRFGLRGGWIEVFLQKLISEFHGQNIDDEGYLYTDESCTLISDPSIINADEAEEYSTSTEYRFGDMKMNSYRYFSAMLRALQMRINALWINLYSDEDTNYALTQFVANEMGCDVANAPDAWVFLRQNNISRVYNSNEFEPCKNFERWLYQRDREDGYQSEPAMPVDMDLTMANYVGFAPDGEKYSYTARRTDIASENNKIGFAIDDRFISGTERVALKISYHDIGNVKWGLRYTNSKGEPTELTYQTNNSNKVKTITYFISDADFSAQDKDFDFELYTLNGDVAFSFVRVIKLQ